MKPPANTRIDQASVRPLVGRALALAVYQAANVSSRTLTADRPAGSEPCFPGWVNSSIRDVLPRRLVSVTVASAFGWQVIS